MADRSGLARDPICWEPGAERLRKCFELLPDPVGGVMHSSTELGRGDFAILVEGRRVPIEDVLPGFDEQSRLGIIAASDFGAVGASSLLMAAVTSFYDGLRSSRPDGFIAYPDYFIFHVGRKRGNHHMLEVFPDHKEVVVGAEPEAIVRAINDRGVTHLLVPDNALAASIFEPQTADSAERRLRGAIVYSPSGRVPEADISVRGNARVDAYVRDTLEGARWANEFEAEGGDPASVEWARSRVGEVSEEDAMRMLRERNGLVEFERTTETFRRTDVEIALQMLTYRKS